MPVTVAFLNLFVTTFFKNALVKDVWSLVEGGGGWNPLFLRRFDDWVVEEELLGVPKLEDNTNKHGR